MVHFNDEMLKIYDNGKLTIVDAALQAGLDTAELFPRRGSELNITVNGISRMIRGVEGESAIVKMNGEVVGLNTPLKRDSDIEFVPSTIGSSASAKVSDLAEYTTDNLYFNVNQKRVACPKFVEVNGVLESGEYELKDGDKVDTRNYYTVGQLAKFMDVQINPNSDILVNNKVASLDTLVYENFSVDWDTIDYASMDETVDAESSVESSVGEEAFSEETESKSENPATIKSISVKINGNAYTLSGQKDYIFVDIFKVYPFDTNQAHGRAVYTKINSNPCGYVDKIKDGDSVEIGWKEN